MKITIAKDAGYCFGVRDAVELAYKSAEENGEVYMLGDIVHNEQVVSELADTGQSTCRQEVPPSGLRADLSARTQATKVFRWEGWQETQLPPTHPHHLFRLMP